MASYEKPEKESHVVKQSLILDRAGTLFWEKGYHSTNMRDIARACNCQPANIYHYFKNKEDILYQVIKDITERTIQAIKHLEEDDTTSPAEQIKIFVRNHLRILVTLKKSNVLMPDTALRDLTPEHREAIIKIRDTYDGILRKILRRGIDRGDFAEFNEKIIGYFISSVIIRTNLWFSPDGSYSEDEIADMIVNFIYTGIKTCNNIPARNH
jgi:TetR/AcrR family transcriptional regulator, cholesterol catabolism regulator